MSFKKIILSQYRDRVDQVAKQLEKITLPNEGWIRTTRKALGMSGAQLARRHGVTRAQISKLEKTEMQGSVTLGKMQQLAETMNCRFVYAIVPQQNDIESLVEKQARKKAHKLVFTSGQHMALESQALSNDKMRSEINRLMDEMIANPPSDFWDDE